VQAEVERATRDTDELLARGIGTEVPELTVEPAGPFTLSGRLQSFRYAVRGVRLMLRSQHNAWLHAVASCCVLIVGGLCLLSIQEWCWIVLAIMAVWTAEALNTALEFLADVASPEFHPLVERAKDVAAGGVLVAAGGSVIIALLVIGPHLLHMLAHLL
jgi:diacylglycerol kinase (ATP)